ncbi:hypothetical protein F4826_004752 [Rahnella inusitata]|nr:hypothetical protein [Rahnella inusitata]
MYLNDKKNQQTIMRYDRPEDFVIFRNWVQENHADLELVSSKQRTGLICDVQLCLHYFGYTVEGFLDDLFDILPARSSNAESNRELIRIVLQNPEMPKSKCCELSGKNPTHYNRLIQTIEENCAKAAKITGGRNPILIIRSIRSDF